MLHLNIKVASQGAAFICYEHTSCDIYGKASISNYRDGKYRGDRQGGINLDLHHDLLMFNPDSLGIHELQLLADSARKTAPLCTY